MENKISNFIIDFFKERNKLNSYTESDFLGINFVELNLLDSIEFITLISEIEENFNILFTQEDIQSSLFSSVEGISKIAIKHLSA